MPEYPVGFGLLGAGLVAPFHAKALNNSTKTRIVAVADVDEARARKLAEEFGCRAYASLDQMLADPEIRCVNVLTPNAFHYDAVMAAAEAGRHVLVEKPPAMSLRETDSMIATCAARGVKLGIVLQCRVRRPIVAMKRALAEGRFGRPLLCAAHMKWFRSIDYPTRTPGAPRAAPAPA